MTTLAALDDVAPHIAELPAHSSSTFWMDHLHYFSIVRTIGQGSFGRVYLVRNLVSGGFYALKVMKKTRILASHQVQHVRDEIALLKAVDSPYLVKLERAFQDEQNLYLLMEYVPGGELFSLLRKHQRFSREWATFFMREIVCALEYLHEHGIAYRDLKPENVLIDRWGHIKIADFGFAKVVPSLTWTMCGTPEYLAPEVISGTGHNCAVDWWSAGILMFEMMAGFSPFFAKDNHLIYEKVMRGQMEFPPIFDYESRDLISAFLTQDKSRRIGNLVGGARDVMAHPFFSGTDWIALRNYKSPGSIVHGSFGLQPLGSTRPPVFAFETALLSVSPSFASSNYFHSPNTVASPHHMMSASPGPHKAPISTMNQQPSSGPHSSHSSTGSSSNESASSSSTVPGLLVASQSNRSKTEKSQMKLSPNFRSTGVRQHGVETDGNDPHPNLGSLDDKEMTKASSWHGSSSVDSTGSSATGSRDSSAMDATPWNGPEKSNQKETSGSAHQMAHLAEQGTGHSTSSSSDGAGTGSSSSGWVAQQEGGPIVDPLQLELRRLLLGSVGSSASTDSFIDSPHPSDTSEPPIDSLFAEDVELNMDSNPALPESDSEDDGMDGFLKPRHPSPHVPPWIPTIDFLGDSSHFDMYEEDPDLQVPLHTENCRYPCTVHKCPQFAPSFLHTLPGTHHFGTFSNTAVHAPMPMPLPQQPTAYFAYSPSARPPWPTPYQQQQLQHIQQHQGHHQGQQHQHHLPQGHRHSPQPHQPKFAPYNPNPYHTAPAFARLFEGF